MKRCSTCNRTYSDPNLSFCIDDGTPLTTIPAEDESTVVSPPASETTSGSKWNQVPYQPPSSYVPSSTGNKRRRVWPWVVGIAGAFILGIVAISVAAFLLAPRLIRRAQNEQAPVAVETRNDNQSENSNAGASKNANSDVTVDADAPPPTDHSEVLAQLTDLENEWTVANLNADKRKLNRILADDYVGPDQDNNPQSKAEYIRTIQRDDSVEKWEFNDLSLALAGDRATLTGRVTLVGQGRELKLDFKDKFVWREGRWQATGSVVTRRE